MSAVRFIEGKDAVAFMNLLEEILQNGTGENANLGVGRVEAQ